MTDRNYTILDAGHIGPALEISLGGLQLDFNTTPADIHRMARAFLGVSSGIHRFDVAFWSEPRTQTIANAVSVGIVTASASASKYVGEDSNGYGFRDGNIYHNATPTATTVGYGLMEWISVVLDADNNTVTFYVGGNPVGTASITSGQTWFPAITVSGAIAYSLSAIANFGQRKFPWIIENTDNGWSTARTGIGVIRIASEDFLSQPGDSPSNTYFEGRILNAEGLTIVRQSKVWPWSDHNDSATISTFDIDNFDGLYDEMLLSDIRDSEVAFAMQPVGAFSSLGSSEPIATGIIDKIEAIGQDVIRVTLRDKMALLQRPLQKAIFPPWAAESARNKPEPISLGAVRQMTPVLYDKVNRRYNAHDEALGGISAVFDQADPLNPLAVPPDWVPTQDGKGFQLQTDSVGKLTADVSSVGSIVIPPGPSDILGGDGSFTTWVGDVPNGWTVYPTSGFGACFQNPTGVCHIDSSIYSDPFGGLFGFWIKTTAAVLKSGKTYQFSFRLRVCGGINDVFTGHRFGIALKSQLSVFSAFSITQNTTPLNVPGLYSGYYTNPAGSDRPVYICVFSGSPALGGYPSGDDTYMEIDDLVITEVVGYTPPPLQGITFQQFVSAVLGDRFGMSSTGWSAVDAAKIDTDTGYVFGVSAVEPINADQMLKRPMDSLCATTFTDADGVIRFARLVDPDDAPDADIVLEIDPSNIKAAASGVAMIQFSRDKAEGLTSYFGARHNWSTFTDADFVSDTIEISPEMRTQLKRASQFICVSNVQLAQEYLFAQGAAVLDSLLDIRKQAQIEIDRVCGLYKKLRFFRTFTVLYSDVAPVLNFGTIVRATYDRFGLAKGKKLFVVGVVHRPVALEIDVITWGA